MRTGEIPYINNYRRIDCCNHTLRRSISISESSILKEMVGIQTPSGGYTRSSKEIYRFGLEDYVTSERVESHRKRK